MNYLTLLDFSTILYKSFHLAVRIAKEEERSISRIDIMEKLFFMMNRVFSTYKKCYVIMDGEYGNDWRRKIFPEYKHGRKKHSEINVLYDCLDEIRELLSFYPCKIIRVKKAEADDSIYILAEKYSPENNILVLTTDKDLIQLINYFKKLEVYNMFDKKYYEKDDLIVEKKIIIGDPSDNILGITRIGIKTFEKMIEDKELYKEKTKGYENLIETFRKVVDLRLIPDKIKELILEQDEKEIFNEYLPEKIEWHFYMNKYKRLLDTWHNYESEIKK